MNTLRYIELIFYFIFLNWNCNAQKTLIIPLEHGYLHQEEITTQDFVESFIYIPLETTEECLIGANPKIDLTENNIIITDTRQCLVFDRNSGKFIKQIVHYGIDPGGYISTQGFYNDYSGSFYFLGWNNNLIKYSAGGKQIGSVPIPSYNNSFTNTFLPEKFTHLNENVIVCNILNINGIQNTLLLIFDEKGKEMMTVPNYYRTKEHKPGISSEEVNFFHFNGMLFFNEIFNDTIFRIKTNRIEPYIIYKREKYKISRENRGLPTEKIWIKNFLESDKFIAFNFFGYNYGTYFALYNKETTKLKVCELGTGIKNTTNNFLPFIPMELFQDRLVGLFQPIDLEKWIDENKDRVKSIPQELQRILLTKPTDNPIVIISILKK